MPGILLGLSRALWFVKLSYILRVGPPLQCALWLCKGHAAMDNLQVRGRAMLLLASVHGAQDPVATAFLGHTCRGPPAWCDKQCCCLSGPMVPRMLYNSLPGALFEHTPTLRSQRLQPLGRQLKEFSSIGMHPHAESHTSCARAPSRLSPGCTNVHNPLPAWMGAPSPFEA